MYMFLLRDAYSSQLMSSVWPPESMGLLPCGFCFESSATVSIRRSAEILTYIVLIGYRVTSLSDALSNKLGSVNNQTNLALKGIIGIGAMAKIAEAMNRTDDAQRFNVR